MVTSTPALERLVDLAKVPSSDSRRELLREVTDLFLGAPASHSAQEVGQFGAVMTRLAQDVEARMRAEIATRMAKLPNAPAELIRFLAHDEIEIASPVITHSPVLTDDDLVSVATAKSQAHLLAMTKRETLSAVVSDAIVARGEDDVLESLAANTGAEISRRSMETLVTRSEASPRLQAPLVARNDTPPDLLNDMFFFVSGQLRQAIIAKCEAMDESVLEDLFAEAEESVREALAASVPGFEKAERIIDDKIKRRELGEASLVQMFRSGQLPLFVVGFARLADLDIKTAHRIISERNFEAMAIAAKAAGFERSTFATFVLVGETNGRQTPETVRILSLYDKMPVDTAQRTIRFWKVRRAALGSGGKTN